MGNMKKTMTISKQGKRAQSDFLHDLRTPLTVMKMHMEVFDMMKEYGDERKTKALLKMLTKQIHRFGKLIADFEKRK